MVGNINFGRKIPITKCQVQNKFTHNSVPVVVYELDCKDKEDWLSMREDKGYWTFAQQVSYQIEEKHDCLAQTEDIKFHVLKNEKDELLGFMESEDMDDTLNVHVLESSPSGKFKYIGKVLLGTAAKVALKEGKQKLTVSYPLANVRDFYIYACGFKPTATKLVEMNRQEMAEFIKRTEEQTNSQIIDLKG